MPKIATLSVDDFDRKLLTWVQRNNRLTHEQLATKVGISPSAVRRRLARLRADRVIVADVSLLDPSKRVVTVITSIRMVTETRAVYEAFRRKMKDASEVAQCYTVSGESDFIVIAHFDSLGSYEEWIDAYILSDDAVQRSETNIVYSCVKYDTSIPV